MRILLLTSDELRHRYVAHELASAADLAGIVAEPKSSQVRRPAGVSAADQATLDSHFSERDRVERRMLPDPGDFPPCEVVRIPPGSMNSPACLDWIQSRTADVLVLYGSGIVGAALLEAFPERIINLHLGLSPYYRGAGTNFWPLVDGLPECVGATIHLAAAKVDAGPILAQVRPDCEPDDGPHELGTHTLRAATRTLSEVLGRWAEAPLPRHAQDLTVGRVFRIRDMHAGAVHTLRRNFADGMLPAFLERREERIRRFPIVRLPG